MPDAGSGWRPRIWDSYLSPRGEFLHRATDIVASEGTPIRSVTSGRVLVSWRDRPGAGWSEKGGWYVFIRDENGFEHYYSHLQKKPKVKPGQRVRAGQVIGYVGRTGNAVTTCPHLHYAITTSAGNKVNPFPILKPLYDTGDWIFTDYISAGAVVAAIMAIGTGIWILVKKPTLFSGNRRGG